MSYPPPPPASANPYNTATPPPPPPKHPTVAQGAHTTVESRASPAVESPYSTYQQPQWQQTLPSHQPQSTSGTYASNTAPADQHTPQQPSQPQYHPQPPNAQQQYLPQQQYQAQATTTSQPTPNTSSHPQPSYFQSQSQPDLQQQPAAPSQPSSNPPYDPQNPPALPAPNWTPALLQDKTKPYLEEILSTPSLLTALLHSPRTSHPALQHSTTQLATYLDANMQLATHLKSTLGQLEAARAATSAHLLAVRALEVQWRKKQAELEAKLEPWGARQLHGRLARMIAEGEALARGVEESFLARDGVAGEREVAEWVRKVRDDKERVWLRRERKARWDEGRVGGWR